MSKRLTFILSSLLLAGGLALINFVSREQQLLAILVYGVFAFAVSAYAENYNLRGIKVLTLLTLPTLFSLGMAFTQYFFPNLALSFKAVLWGLTLMILYVIYLAENIFNVTLEKKIPLYRAAKTVSFLLTIMVAFLHFTTIYKANLPLYGQLLSNFVLVSLLSFQFLWAIDLKHQLDPKIVLASLLLGLGVGEVSLGISFLPLKSFFRAIALSSGVYIGLGIAQQYFQHSLSKKIVYEYSLTALIIVLLLASF